MRKKTFFNFLRANKMAVYNEIVLSVFFLAIMNHFLMPRIYDMKVQIYRDYGKSAPEYVKEAVAKLYALATVINIGALVLLFIPCLILGFAMDHGKNIFKCWKAYRE